MNRWMVTTDHVRKACEQHPYLQNAPAVRASLLDDLRADIERATETRAGLGADEQRLLDRELHDARQMLKNFEAAEGSTLFHSRPNPKALN